MSQRSEKLHRQVAALRSDVDTLQAAWPCHTSDQTTVPDRTARRYSRRCRQRRRAWKETLAALAIVTAILAASFAAGYVCGDLAHSTAQSLCGWTDYREVG